MAILKFRRDGAEVEVVGMKRGDKKPLSTSWPFNETKPGALELMAH